MGVDGDKLTWGASVEAGSAESKLRFPAGSVLMADGHVIGVVEGNLKEAQRIFIMVSNRDLTSSQVFITAYLARGWKPKATNEYMGWQRASLADLAPDQIRALTWTMAEHAAARTAFVNLKTPPKRPAWRRQGLHLELEENQTVAENPPKYPMPPTLRLHTYPGQLPAWRRRP